MKSAMVDRQRPRRKPLKCENGAGSKKKPDLKNLSGNAAIFMLFGCGADSTENNGSISNG